ncbi:MAG: restriction endonuclease subunit S [Methylobacter sp.]|nr:restriction endonuclease subunit S [Candidatus Methylobacter titanis]
MKWDSNTLGELVKTYGGRIQTGPFGSQLHQHDYKLEGIPVVMPKDIINDRFDTRSISKISEDDADRLGKHKLSIGDLVLPRRGDINKRALCKQENIGWICGTGCLKIRLNDNIVDPNYLYYYFNLSTVVESILNKAVGSTMLNLSGGILSSIKLIYPPLPTQHKIASILSAYDDLIENNLKRIKLLEEKAFLTYKGIVRDEEMVSVNKLEEIIQVVKRKPKILKSDYKGKGDFPIIDQSTDFIGGYTDEKEAIYEDIPMIVFGDHTRILKYINFPFACGADGTQLVKPKNPNVSDAYLYFELISCNLSNYHYARHFKFLKEQIIKLPSETMMKDYKTETDRIFNLIQTLRLTNTKLREARDILLPKLMNGQITV